MSRSIVLEKAIKFALRIVAVYKYLTDEKREFVMSKQLLLSATFIAKHAKSALHSQTGGFSSEMYIALQKGLDTELWPMLLHEGDFLSEKQFISLNADCVELIKLTSSISKTTRSNE
ncbi:MAG: four helix bundle protein [Pyrinomonadaceae bacterium]